MCYTENNRTCVFPFVSDGEKYTQCIDGKTDSRRGSSWCPYEINSDLTGKHWAWCKIPNCSEEGDNLTNDSSVNIDDSTNSTHDGNRPLNKLKEVPFN